MERHYMTHDQLIERLDEWAQEAESGNRHDFAESLWDLQERTSALSVGETFFGVIDFDAYGDDRYALIQLVDEDA